MKIKRTKKQLIDLIVLVVGSINNVVDEKLLSTWNDDKLINILQKHTNKSYNRIKFINN